MSARYRTIAEVSIALCTHAERFPLVYSAANLSKLRFASSVNDTVMMVLSSLMVKGATMLLINNPAEGIKGWENDRVGVLGGHLWCADWLASLAKIGIQV